MIKKITAIVLLVCTFSFSASAIYCYDDPDFRKYISEKCEEYSIDKALVCGVIECESGWHSDAVNYDGSCIGLMQINKVNLSYLRKNVGTNDLYDPYQNAEAGIFMLSGYMEKYDDVDMVLMCYNCGEYGALKLKAQGISNTYYSRRVQEVMANYIDEVEECISINKVFSPIEDVTTANRTDNEYRICKE